MALKTVKIKVEPCEGNEAGEVVINEQDYDPAVHTLVDETVVPVVWKTKNKAELQAYLDAKSVDYLGSMSKAELVALCEANP